MKAATQRLPLQTAHEPALIIFSPQLPLCKRELPLAKQQKSSSLSAVALCNERRNVVVQRLCVLDRERYLIETAIRTFEIGFETVVSLWDAEIGGESVDLRD